MAPKLVTLRTVGYAGPGSGTLLELTFSTIASFKKKKGFSSSFFFFFFPSVFVDFLLEKGIWGRQEEPLTGEFIKGIRDRRRPESVASGPGWMWRTRSSWACLQRAS